MKAFYAVRESFRELIEQFPHVVEELNEAQREQVLESIDLEALSKSTRSYFQCEVVLEERSLYLLDEINNEQQLIECGKNFVLVEDENTWFFALLKRIYPCFFITDRELT